MIEKLKKQVEDWRICQYEYIEEIGKLQSQRKEQQTKIATKSARVNELQKCINDLNKIIEEETFEFTANDIDGIYLLGVFNTGGLNGLAEEIKRLKKLKIQPSQMIGILKTSDIKNPGD